jgi:hypothetical protein
VKPMKLYVARRRITVDRAPHEGRGGSRGGALYRSDDRVGLRRERSDMLERALPFSGPGAIVSWSAGRPCLWAALTSGNRDARRGINDSESEAGLLHWPLLCYTGVLIGLPSCPSSRRFADACLAWRPDPHAEAMMQSHQETHLAVGQPGTATVATLATLVTLAGCQSDTSPIAAPDQVEPAIGVSSHPERSRYTRRSVSIVVGVWRFGGYTAPSPSTSAANPTA